MTALPAPTRPDQLAGLVDLAAIPEEEVWLASQKSARTRRAYRLDVAHFMRTLGITTPDQIRQVDHRAVIAWEGQKAHLCENVPDRVKTRKHVSDPQVSFGVVAPGASSCSPSGLKKRSSGCLKATRMYPPEAAHAESSVV